MEYTITPQYHDQKDCYIYVVRLSERIDKYDFSILSDLAKSHKGYYSSFRGVNGFVFKSEEQAEEFCADMMAVLETLKDSTQYSAANVTSSVEPSPPVPPTTSGMELHKVLRHIIKTDGEDIICELRLVNILSDLNAYGDIQGAKYILRTLIDEGVTKKLLQIGTYDNSAKDLAHRFVNTTGFNAEAVNIIFNSLAYGLKWIAIMPKVQNVSSPSTNSNTQVPTKRNRRGKHLLFRNIEIAGHPQDFAESLIAIGYELGSWFDYFFTLHGAFAGVSNCDLFVYFDPTEDTVYRIRVAFPTYQNRDRVVKDYKKLKKSLTDLYGKPECEDERSSTFTIPTGIIILSILMNNVDIDYYDGYYDNHHGEIVDDIAKLDL